MIFKSCFSDVGVEPESFVPTVVAGFRWDPASAHSVLKALIVVGCHFA